MLLATDDEFVDDVGTLVAEIKEMERDGDDPTYPGVFDAAERVHEKLWDLDEMEIVEDDD